MKAKSKNTGYKMKLFNTDEKIRTARGKTGRENTKGTRTCLLKLRAYLLKRWLEEYVSS